MCPVPRSPLTVPSWLLCLIYWQNISKEELYELIGFKTEKDWDGATLEMLRCLGRKLVSFRRDLNVNCPDTSIRIYRKRQQPQEDTAAYKKYLQYIVGYSPTPNPDAVAPAAALPAAVAPAALPAAVVPPAVALPAHPLIDPDL